MNDTYTLPFSSKDLTLTMSDFNDEDSNKSSVLNISEIKTLCNLGLNSRDKAP